MKKVPGERSTDFNDQAARRQRSGYQYESPGTLEAPGPVGRFVRMALGLVLLWVVYRLLFHSHSTDLTHLPFWSAIVIALWVLPAVVNIGWGRSWDNWRLRSVAVVVGLLASATSYVAYGTWLGDPLWWFVLPTSLYVLGHLGISFVLASVLGTPGCEMRAIAHLIGLLSGHRKAEHYCPGFLDRLDRWEALWKS